MKLRQSLKLAKLIAPTCLIVLASGCGYHLRTSKAWPNALRTIQINANDIPAEARFNMMALLKAMHVHHNPDANFVMTFKHYKFKQTLPSTVSSSLPVQITATASIQYSISLKDGSSCIAPVTLSSSFQQSEPANTLIVNNVDPDIKQRLLQNLTDELYQHISSENTLNQLNSTTCLLRPHKVTLKSPSNQTD
jgi:outer membrane lipopolysaccharide assembly protein LptE/RlpB